MNYTIELNGQLVKMYKSEKRAMTKAKEYATNPGNLVRVWCDGIVLWDSSES